MRDRIIPVLDGNGDLLGNADNVGELEADKADIVALDDLVDALQFILFIGEASFVACILLYAEDSASPHWQPTDKGSELYHRDYPLIWQT